MVKEGGKDVKNSKQNAVCFQATVKTEHLDEAVKKVEQLYGEIKKAKTLADELAFDLGRLKLGVDVQSEHD